MRWRKMEVVKKVRMTNESIAFGRVEKMWGGGTKESERV